MIKLLSKSEIDKAKNADKAKEIAEGLKISRKVDSLRELMADEEKALEKFRSESLSAISKEIEEKNSEKIKLENEVRELRREIMSESKLTREERHNLEQLKEVLIKKEEELGKKSQEIDLKEIDIAIALKNSAEDEKRAQNHREIAENLHKKAEEEKNEADLIKQRAQKIEDNINNYKQETENLFVIREIAISQKEQDLILQEEENKKLEQELNKEKIQLADQRATLERALERLRKNRLA